MPMNREGTSSSWLMFVMHRYLTGRSNRRYMSSLFTIMGITIGFITIFVIIGIMNGLQSGYLEDLIEIQSFHLQISVDDQTDPLAIRSAVLSHPGVSSAVQYLDTNALLEYGDRQYYPCILRGVEDDIFTTDEGFLEHTSLDDGSITRLGVRELIVSDHMRQMLYAIPGSTMNMMLMGVGKVVPHVPITFESSIAGIYRSDFPDIDSGFIFTSLETLKLLLPQQRPLLGIKLTDLDTLETTAEDLALITGVETVTTWKEANESFYAALMIEKYGMMLLLSLIFLVVIMNAKTSFEKYVFHKKDDIGILRSLGASRGEVYTIFLLQGSLIVLTGILLGSLLGYLTAYHINEIIRAGERLLNFLFDRRMVFLTYTFPVVIEIREMFAVGIAILLLSITNMYFAVATLVKKSPLEILWYE
ncbi:MAG: ABC transporter permease [Spirochaetia bacterium]|nr:ABC transporter permease [Spirochaetia bacterium]